MDNSTNNESLSEEKLSQYGSMICRDFRDGNRSSQDVAKKEFIRVVVWNIERGYKLRGIINELIKLDPDVVLLQEVDIFTGRYKENNELVDEDKEIATALKMNSVAAIEMSLVAGGAQCNTVMTRYDIKNPRAVVHATQPIDRSVAKPTDNYPRKGVTISIYYSYMTIGLRTAASAIVESPIGDILFYSDHFEMECGMEGRLGQLRDLLEDSKLQESQVQCQVLAGDLNTFSAGLARIFKTNQYGPLNRALFGVATESEFWNQAIFYPSSSSRPQQYQKWNDILPTNPGFSDPFGEQSTVRLYGGLYEAKLDWALLRNAKCINKFIGNNDLSLSDHKYLCVDIAPDIKQS